VAVGEVAWSLTRGLAYAIGFLVVMLALGLVLSPTGILAIPGALLIGLAAAAVGMAACTYMRKWQDFDLVAVATTPMFLFSGTFFPITVYPDWLRVIVELTPLYRGVHMLRSFTTGDVGPMVLLDVAYLGAMGVIGVAITSRRLRLLLLK
jgi:lipooligosaccharide transport system permease protein